MTRGAFAKMALLCFLVAACLTFELVGPAELRAR
jgi:predicted small secreted protein